MPNFTLTCIPCNETTVLNIKIADRDNGIQVACTHCKNNCWSRAFCEAKNVDTHFPGAHRLEYGKLSRRKGY